MVPIFPTRQVVARHIERAVALDPALGLMDDPNAGVAAEGFAPLHAMVVGVDVMPRVLPVAEVAAFGDPFTRHLLLEGVVPLTLAQLDKAITALPGDEARPLRKLYAVAEGAAFQQTNPRLPLNARLVLTWQKDQATDPDLLLSTTADPEAPEALLQLIAWSESQSVYHFFERLAGRWVWAGSSLDALRPESRGQGPFDSHINGGLVMKELKFPWVHWHSQSRSIDRELLFPSAELDSHPLFAQLEGAQVLEAVVQRGVRRWTQRRIQRDLTAGRLASLQWYARQILWTTSVNLTSSETLFRELPSVEEITLPSSFFLDVDGLSAAVRGLDEDRDILPGEVSVSSPAYRQALADLHVHVEANENGPSSPGDTDFVFVVPERAFEDTVVVEQLIANQVLSPRLALCLLMVDFNNPMFSPDRAGLLKLFPEETDAGNQGASLDLAVIAAARAQLGDAGARRLVALWDEANLLDSVQQQLAAFVDASQNRLRSADGVHDLLKVADSRRQAFRGRKLNEFRHTTAISGAPVAHLAFDGSANIIVKTSTSGEKEL